MKLHAPRAVLFDLDGTLVDSAPDLIAAVAHVRTLKGLSNEVPERCGQFVSAGAVAMLRVGLPESLHSEMDALREDFLRYYFDHICVHTKFYPGVMAMLKRLDAQGIGWGVVTNKPIVLTHRLLKELRLDAPVVVGGDSLANKKPHPEPLQFALHKLAVDASSSWMVGDDPRDIQAGWNAGCAATIACAYGYLGDNPTIDAWGASWIAHSIDQLRL